MPTYEYRCRDCGDHLEVHQAFTDDPLTECPSCGGSLRKKFGNVGIAFKGSGFYKNDSRGGSSSGGSGSAGSGAGSSASSGDGAVKDAPAKEGPAKDATAATASTGAASGSSSTTSTTSAD